MGNLKKKLKKGMVLALSAAMVVGLAPSVFETGKEVQAADTNTSLAGYVTKEQLLAGDANGNLKINFGKNESGQTQSWYVLGKDDGVSGDNTALFATSGIMESQKFNDTRDEKVFAIDSFDGTYDLTPTKLLPNNYGASSIRQKLKDALTGTTYFSTAEKALMNETTVTTSDVQDVSITRSYTTTDKLYLPYVEGGVGVGCRIGSDNQLNVKYKVLPKGNGNSYVMTRVPYDSKPEQYRYVYQSSSGTNYTVGADYVDYKNGEVYPATNINLSDVLFASAVPTDTSRSQGASGDVLDANNAMSLRVDAKKKGMSIGTATINKVSRNFSGSVMVSDTVKKQFGNASVVALCAQWTENGVTHYYRASSTGDNLGGGYRWSEEYLSDKTFDELGIKAWIEATVDGVTYAQEAVDITPTYTMEAGQDGTWTENTDTTYTFKANGELSKFTGVSVDGNLVSEDNYTKESGSTIITFNEDYLKTLSDGAHTVSMAYNDGYPATATFTVKKDNSSAGGGENHGDNTWTKDSDTGLVVKPDTKIPTVEEVKVDDKTLEKDKDYTVDADGNVTINKDYMDKLEEGDHKVDIIGKDENGADKSTSTTITVKPASGNNGGNGNNGSTNGDNPYNKPDVVTPSGDTITKGETTDYPVVKPTDDKKLPTVDKVTVDGNELEKDKDYTVDENGNVTIKKDYIDSLPTGDHTIEIIGKNENGESDSIKKDLTVANPANGGETWTPASNKDYVVSPDNKLAEVDGVKINGNWVDPKDYTIASDGTLTLKKDYLATLPNGNYTIEIIGKDANGNAATAHASFTVAGSSVGQNPAVDPGTTGTPSGTGTQTSVQSASPKTGEAFFKPVTLVWGASLIVLLAVLASMIAECIKNRRRI